MAASPVVVSLSLLAFWLLQGAAGTSSFLSAYRGFSLFLNDNDVRASLQGGQISNELSIFENGFENRWLTSALSTPHIAFASSKRSVGFVWENRGKYALHYHVNGVYRNSARSSTGNNSPQPHITIPSNGFLLPGTRKSFSIEFPCTLDTIGSSILEITFDVGQTLRTSLFFLRKCTAEYANRQPAILSNSYEDLDAATPVRDVATRRNGSETACILAKRYCGFAVAHQCPQERHCKRVCRMSRKRNGDRLGRICNASAVITARLVSKRARREGRCGTVMQFSTEYAQTHSKGGRSAHIAFASMAADTFRVVVPEEIARCRCFADLAPGSRYILTGRWNAVKSRLHLDTDSLVVKLRRKLISYLIRSEC